MENNRFLLTMMVAKRAKQLIAGVKPLVETESRSKAAIALKEIEEGKVYLKEQKTLKEEDPLKKVFRFRPEEEDWELESRLSPKVWKRGL